MDPHQALSHSTPTPIDFMPSLPGERTAAGVRAPKYRANQAEVSLTLTCVFESRMCMATRADAYVHALDGTRSDTLGTEGPLDWVELFLSANGRESAPRALTQRRGTRSALLPAG
jgi:hypothetical protein